MDQDIVQDIVLYFSAKSHVAPGPSYARDLPVVERGIPDAAGAMLYFFIRMICFLFASICKVARHL